MVWFGKEAEESLMRFVFQRKHALIACSRKTGHCRQKRYVKFVFKMNSQDGCATMIVENVNEPKILGGCNFRKWP